MYVTAAAELALKPTCGTPPLVRVAICADMEGLSGIDRYEQCFPSWPGHYRHGVDMLVGEVRSAAEAALQTGAGDVVVADWHYLGRNLRPLPGLSIRRLWRDGRPDFGPDGLGGPDAAVLVGMHAGAGNPAGFLSHTFWMGMSLLLDGMALSESVLWTLALGGAGIPVVAVAGDQRATEEASHLLPGIRAVAVKAGTSRTSAILRPPEDARDELAETVRKALAERGTPVTHPFPADATIRYGDTGHAAAADRAGVGERTGPRDVSARLGSVHDLMAFLARGLLATPLGRGPSAADRMYPRNAVHGTGLWSRGLLAAIGWAERRAVSSWSNEPADRYPRLEGPGDQPRGGGGGSGPIGGAGGGVGSDG